MIRVHLAYVYLWSEQLPTLKMISHLSALLPPANEVWGKAIFSHQFVILFTGGGVCMVLFGGTGVGGVCGFIRGGMHGFIWGACVVFSVFFGYNEIRSMSGRYASYWNAFLYCH